MAEALPVVIINEAMAKQYWIRGDDPLTARLIIGRHDAGIQDEPERQIVGIVGDVRDGGTEYNPQPRMYTPQAQVPDAVNALNVRITPIAWTISDKGRTASLSARIRKTPQVPACRFRYPYDG